MLVTRRDIEAQDSLALVLASSYLIVGVGNLEPVSRAKQVQVEHVSRVRLKVKTIENRTAVADVVERPRFRRVEEAAGSRAIQRQKFPQLLCPEANVRLSPPGSE